MGRSPSERIAACLYLLAAAQACLPEAVPPKREPPSPVEANRPEALEAVPTSSTAIRVDTPTATATPKWISEPEDSSEVVYGVGRSLPLKNRALARMVAENRARSAIARALSPSGKGASGRRLEGVEIIDHWTDPVSGAIFARARLRREASTP